MQYPSMVRRPITTSAARRACGKILWFATSRETASAVTHACVPRESRLRVGGHSSQVAPRTCSEGERPSAGAVPFHSALAEHSQRGTARTWSKLAHFVTFRETASAVAPARVPHKSRLCAGGHDSNVAPRSCTEGDRPFTNVVFFFIEHTPIAAIAAQRTRTASSRVSSPPER